MTHLASLMHRTARLVPVALIVLAAGWVLTSHDTASAKPPAKPGKKARMKPEDDAEHVAANKTPGQPPAARAGAANDPRAVAAAIDRLIDAELAAAKLPASPAADDAEFIRRASLDIRGRIPTGDRVAAFLADTDPGKRARLVDEFLADPEYGEHFGIVWYHRIVKRDDDNRMVVSESFREWLAEQFNENRGWDRVVRDILTASGDRDQNPATVFWLANVGADRARNPEPSKVTASATRVFLGIRLECCECHNHPFTPSLTQKDFWGTAAFFTQVHSEHARTKMVKEGATPAIGEGPSGDRRGMKKGQGQEADHAPAGSIVIPDTKGKTVPAKFLGGVQPNLAGKTTLRPVFAGWATSPNNPFFARAAVNKVWANFFGKGLVNPVDDIRPETPIPPVLAELSAEFTASGFDFKHLIRCVTATAAYRRTSAPLPANKEDSSLASHMSVKVMTADMLYDSLQVVLGRTADEPPQKGMKQKGKKKIGSAREQFRAFFHAEADDDVGVTEEYTHGIPQALRLMNANAMTHTGGVIERLRKNADAPDAMTRELFLATLSRLPTDAEAKKVKQYLAGGSDPVKNYRDVLWALLNTAEFVCNH